MTGHQNPAERRGGRWAAAVDGFTIVEALVAILLLTVGGLALMSAAASLPAVVAEGRSDQQLAVFATTELEHLRMHACVGAASGERSVGARKVAWTVVAVGADVFRLQVLVTSETHRGTRVDTLTGSVVC
jgi:Tfp pilus assembly protein PilV